MSRLPPRFVALCRLLGSAPARKRNRRRTPDIRGKEKCMPKSALPCLIAAASLFCPQSAAADAVTDWNASAGRAALAACIAPADDPLHESRMYAMMHIAIHDALNAIERRSRPYAYDAPLAPSASRDAAVAAAARGVLVPLIGQIPAPFPLACIQAGDRKGGA